MFVAIVRNPCAKASTYMRLIAQGGVEMDGVKVIELNCEVRSGAVLSWARDGS